MATWSGYTMENKYVEGDNLKELFSVENRVFKTLHFSEFNVETGEEYMLLEKVLSDHEGRIHVRFIRSAAVEGLKQLAEEFQDRVELIFIYIEDCFDVIEWMVEKRISCSLKLTNFISATENAMFDQISYMIKDIDNELLDRLIQVYESGLKVVSIDIKVESITEEVKGWNELKRLMNEKGDTTAATISVNRIDVDAEWLQSFFSSCIYESKIIGNGTANYLNLMPWKSLKIGITRYYSTYINVKPLSLSLNVHSVESAGRKLKKIKSVQSVTSLEVKCKKNSEYEQILPRIHRFIKRATNVTIVKIEKNSNEVKLSGIEGSEKIVKLLNSRDTQRLKQLMESNAKGFFNRAKLMVVGGGGAGKTSSCRALLGKAFVKEHLSTRVADGGRSIAILEAKDVNITQAWKEFSSKDKNVYAKDFKAMHLKIIDNEVKENCTTSNIEKQQNKNEFKESLRDIIRRKKEHNRRQREKLSGHNRLL